MAWSVLGLEWPCCSIPKLWDSTLEFSDCFEQSGTDFSDYVYCFYVLLQKKINNMLIV